MSEINVLCVDDEEELVSAWVERLLLRGIEAEGVTNGLEAIQRVKDKNYDVVVLDIKMPGIDGFEIMRRMKTVKPNLPIILITGHQSIEDENKKQLAGAFDCLVKPVNIDILMEKIIKAVKIEDSEK
jgi:two-component system OmpR family response regulator